MWISYVQKSVYNMKVWIYCFVLLFICSSCSSRQKDISLSGIFMTYKPGILEQVRIERRFRGHIYPLPATMIYLRSDSTYVMGFCDNQVREAGRYSYRGDSVRLYDRYNLEENAKIEARTIYYDSKQGLLYFTKPDPNSTMKRLADKIVPLKKNHQYAHIGFLRGQDMSLDSLMRYYKQESVEYQNNWTDSVLKARQSQQ